MALPSASGGESIPPCAPDEIRLTDGRMFRGLVRAAVPHGEVVIDSVGSTYRFEWTDVQQILRDAHCAPCAPGPPPSGPGIVRLHIVSDDPTVALQSDGWKVCEAPCDRMIDGRYHRPFLLVGEDTDSSSELEFSDYQGELTAEVHAGSTTLLGFGIASMALSVLLVTVSVTQATDEEPEVGTAGQWALGIAGGSLLVGGSLMVAFGPTRVELTPGGPTRAAAGRSVRVLGNL
jgi:hypothetical protein